MMLVNFRCRDVLQIWIIVEQEPALNPKDAEWKFFQTLVYLSISYFLLFAGNGLIQTEIPPQRAANNNQIINRRTALLLVVLRALNLELNSLLPFLHDISTL